MSVAELRRELMGLHHQLGAKSPSTLRKVEVQRLIPIYKDIIARQSSTPLPKETHHLPPREITETAKTSEGIEVPVVPPKRETTDRKKPTKAKDIVIVHDTGAAEAVEVKPAHVKKEKVVKEKVEKPSVAEPVVEKKKRVMTEEHKAKMKAGRDAMKAKKAEGVSPPAEPKEKPMKPTEPPAPVPSAKLPSGVRPLA
jgi:hypothetical protein